MCKVVAQPELDGHILRPFNVRTVAGALVGAYFLLNSPLHWVFDSGQLCDSVGLKYANLALCSLPSITHLMKRRRRGG